MRAALRLVRHYQGGVSLGELLASPRLLHLAADEANALYEEVEVLDDHARFDAHAAAFFAQQGFSF